MSGASDRKGDAQRHYPNEHYPNEVDPIDCSELYASGVAGTCLEPVFSDGMCLIFSTTAPVLPGDYVGIWLRPDILHHEEPLPRRVKRLRMGLPPGWTFPLRMASTSTVMPIIELEQFNPPRVYRVPADHILAMHKVVGTGEVDANGRAKPVPLDLDKMADPVLIERLGREI